MSEKDYIYASMDRKLSNDDLQNHIDTFKEIFSKLEESSFIFKNAGLNIQADQIDNVISVIGKSLMKNNSLKKIAKEVDNDLCAFNVNNSDDMLNLNIGDVNLSNDDLEKVDNILFSEMDFEDEI